MNATQQFPCNCTTCPGTGCTCGCQQATEQTAGACSPQSRVSHIVSPISARPSASGVKPRRPAYEREAMPAGAPFTSTMPPESPEATSMSETVMHGK